MVYPSQLQWKGYAIHDTKQYTNFTVIEFSPKPLHDHDVEIKIEYCGVCGTDVHSITGKFGEAILPIIAGHEITGYVTRVGPKVSTIKVGDRAGVGAHIYSCLQCERCTSDNEQYCTETVQTCNAKYPNGDIGYGGYSTAIRAHERYVFPIPDGLSLEQAAPMLCGGLTMYSALIRNGAGPGKRVGIVGIGGLGHFAIQFAKALAADVYVFSRSPEKKDDAVMMGADHFIQTDKPGFAEPLKGQLDLIICTTGVTSRFPLGEYLSTLRMFGRFVMVGVPEDEPPALPSMDMILNGTMLVGSRIGSRKEAIEMLNFAVKHGIKAWIDLLPMSHAAKAIQNVKDNRVRYRHVLKVDI